MTLKFTGAFGVSWFDGENVILYPGIPANVLEDDSSGLMPCCSNAARVVLV
jgi:hypothetical protein